MYNCNICNTEFADEIDLINHNKSKHSADRPKRKKENTSVKSKRLKSVNLKCNVCRKQFTTNKELQKHRYHHFFKNAEDLNFSDEIEGKDEYIEEKTAFSRNLIERTWNINNYTDLIKSIQSHKNQILKLIYTTIREHSSPIKFSLAVKLKTFKLTNENEKEFITIGLHSGTHYLATSDEAEERFSDCSQILWENFEKWNTLGSGINLEKVESITLKIAKTRIMQGSSYIPTPKLFPRSILNIRNNDNRCFEYAILAALHYDEIPNGIRYLPKAYKKWIGRELNLKNFPTPMPVFEISRFEKLHDKSINVYYFDTRCKEKAVSPLFISKKRSMSKPINLLLLDDGSKFHYTYITKFSNLFPRKSKNVKFCPYCFQQFWNTKKYDNHVLVCQNYKVVQTRIPTGDKMWIEFNKIEAMEEHPVVIYADFETLNIPLANENLESKTQKKTAKQEICGYSFVVVSPYFKNRVVTFRGEDAINHFVKSLMKEEKKIEKFFYRNKKTMNVLTPKENDKFGSATHCYICKDEFIDNSSNIVHIKHLQNLLEETGFATNRIPSKTAIKRKIRQVETRLKSNKGGLFVDHCKHLIDKLLEIEEYLLHNDIYDLKSVEQDAEMNDQDLKILKNLRKGCKVKDHNHWNGDYRGAAHAMCNIKMRKFRKIPCFFHNFAGYDSHLLIAGVDSKLIKKQPQVIPKGMEKFLSLTLNNIEFKDSLQFLPGSLDNLVSNLKSKGGNLTEQFPHTWNYFNKRWKHLNRDAFEMITEKLSYPYSYFKSFSNFEEENLPPISSFYNELTETELNVDDYEKVTSLWNKFEMHNLGDLHDLYVEIDVHLLADCFENFRQFALKNYRLDPAHFISAPSLSWQSALLHTNVQLEVPQDIDMHLFIDR